MTDEAGSFQTTGPSWAERAGFGELRAVLSPAGSPRRNLFLHGVNLFAARQVPRPRAIRPVVVDFGCGTGRFLRYWGRNPSSVVVGTEITAEMLTEARKLGCPKAVSLALTDGLTLPLRDKSVDLIWCCGVLRYSLFVPNPCYNDIAREMFRVLKPGGRVANCEVYVDSPPHVFCEGFEKAGFRTKSVHLLSRHFSRMENVLQSSRIPLRLALHCGWLSALLRFRFDSPTRLRSGLRDYLFIWEKSR